MRDEWGELWILSLSIMSCGGKLPKCEGAWTFGETHPLFIFRANLGDPTEGAKPDASAKEGCVALWNVKKGTLLHPRLGSNHATAHWNGYLCHFIAYKLSSKAWICLVWERKNAIAKKVIYFGDYVHTWRKHDIPCSTIHGNCRMWAKKAFGWEKLSYMCM